jgi:hypothetical protein
VPPKRPSTLVGLPAAELRRCVGPPLSVEVGDDGESEKLTYLFYDIPEDDARRPGAQRLPDSQRARIDPKTGRPRRGVGFCEIVVQINKEGMVQSVEAEGVRPDGLADPGCVREKTRRCGVRPNVAAEGS